MISKTVQTVQRFIQERSWKGRHGRGDQMDEDKLISRFIAMIFQLTLVKKKGKDLNDRGLSTKPITRY